MIAVCQHKSLKKSEVKFTKFSWRPLENMLIFISESLCSPDEWYHMCWWESYNKCVFLRHLWPQICLFQNCLPQFLKLPLGRLFSFFLCYFFSSEHFTNVFNMSHLFCNIKGRSCLIIDFSLGWMSYEKLFWMIPSKQFSTYFFQ